MRPPIEEVEDDLAAEEENKLINEVRFTRDLGPRRVSLLPTHLPLFFLFLIGV